MAYVPKPTINPSAATYQDNDNGNSSSDTHMYDATAEEENKCTNSDMTIKYARDAKRFHGPNKMGNSRRTPQKKPKKQIRDVYRHMSNSNGDQK